MTKDFRITCLAWFMDTAATVTAALPNQIRRGVLWLLGNFYAHFSFAQSRALSKNLQTLFNYEPDVLQSTVRQVCKNFVITLYDFFVPDGITLSVPDRPMLEELRKKHSKGILFLTFHLGHWELGARTMQQWGWPVTAVYQPYENKRFKEMIEKRRAHGVNFVPVGGKAANGVREAFRRGDVVAMLGDHPFGETGMPVELLGHHVIWPKGPVVLAVKEQVPIVVAVIVRVGQRQYKAMVEAPLIPKGKSKAEVERLVQKVADKFGKLVAQYPTQWYRFQEFEFVD